MKAHQRVKEASRVPRLENTAYPLGSPFMSLPFVRFFDSTHRSNESQQCSNSRFAWRRRYYFQCAIIDDVDDAPFHSVTMITRRVPHFEQRSRGGISPTRT